MSQDQIIKIRNSLKAVSDSTHFMESSFYRSVNLNDPLENELFIKNIDQSIIHLNKAREQIKDIFCQNSDSQELSKAG